MQNGCKTQQGEHERMSLKFTIGFSGLPFKVKFHQDQKMISEDLALGDILQEHICSKNDVAVFDRGMKDRNVMKGLSEHQQYFVTRIYKNSKYVKAKGTEEVMLDYEDDKIQLLSAKKVHLFTKTRKVPLVFRLVKGMLKASNEEILFLSNLPEEFSNESIAKVYKNRWQIEQFFRFIKQELNFKHCFSR